MDTSDLGIAIVLITGAYLVGSIPTSYLVGRLVSGVDIREQGSGNIGASNLTAQVGAKWAVPVVIFDIGAKGLLPVLIASEKVLDLGIGLEAAAGLAGIAGHLRIGARLGRAIHSVEGFSGLVFDCNDPDASLGNSFKPAE
jgi:glycerol-3-phosphate acyltransferase PlsY